LAAQHAGLHHELDRADARLRGIVRDPQVCARSGRRIEPRGDERFDRARGRRVERRSRLVEQQHVGLELQHAQQRDDLRFAARQLARTLVEKIRAAVGARGERFGARAVVRRVAIDRERVRIAQLRIDRAVHLRRALTHISDAAPVARNCAALDARAAPEELAAIERIEQREGAQQHALAGARWPRDSNSRSCGDAEVGRRQQRLAVGRVAARDLLRVDESGRGGHVENEKALMAPKRGASVRHNTD
jgi:hypothetical protein